MIHRITLILLALTVAADASLIYFSAPPAGTQNAVALVRSNSVNLIGQLAIVPGPWDTGAIDVFDPLGGGTYGFLATYTDVTGNPGVAIAVNEYELADLREGFPKPTVQEAFGCTTEQLVAELGNFSHDSLWHRWLDYVPAQIPYGQTGTVIYLGSDRPDGSFASTIVPEPGLVAIWVVVLGMKRRAM